MVVGGFNPSEKIWGQNGFIFPKTRVTRVNIKDFLKLPPPRTLIHDLDFGGWNGNKEAINIPLAKKTK